MISHDKLRESINFSLIAEFLLMNHSDKGKVKKKI